MRRGGGEGRFPSLMTVAVERKLSNSYFFSFFFDVSSMGAFGLNGDMMRFASTPREYHLGKLCRQAG
jgi:hypothetical protein